MAHSRIFEDYPFNIIKKPAQLSSEYVQRATEDHAYWFCIYGSPPKHIELEKKRQDPYISPEEHLEAITQLSREELGILHPHMVGLEIIRHHEGNDKEEDPPYIGDKGRHTHGIIIASRQDPYSGDVELLLRPYKCVHGRWLVTLIEGGIMNGFSLQHVRYKNYVQLREISICVKGKRPNSVLLGIVQLENVSPLEQTCRRYTHPEFTVTTANNVSHFWKQVALTPNLPLLHMNLSHKKVHAAQHSIGYKQLSDVFPMASTVHPASVRPVIPEPPVIETKAADTSASNITTDIDHSLSDAPGGAVADPGTNVPVPPPNEQAPPIKKTETPQLQHGITKLLEAGDTIFNEIPQELRPQGERFLSQLTQVLGTYKKVMDSTTRENEQLRAENGQLLEIKAAEERQGTEKFAMAMDDIQALIHGNPNEHEAIQRVITAINGLVKANNPAITSDDYRTFRDVVARARASAEKQHTILQEMSSVSQSDQKLSQVNTAWQKFQHMMNSEILASQNNMNRNESSAVTNDRPVLTVNPQVQKAQASNKKRQWTSDIDENPLKKMCQTAWTDSNNFSYTAMFNKK